MTRTIVTYTVAECSEFHNLGYCRNDITDLRKAIRIYNALPKENVPGIGVRVGIYPNETQIDLLIGGHLNLSILDFIPQIRDNPEAMELVRQLEEAVKAHGLEETESHLLNQEQQEEQEEEIEL